MEGGITLFNELDPIVLLDLLILQDRRGEDDLLDYRQWTCGPSDATKLQLPSSLITVLIRSDEFWNPATSGGSQLIPIIRHARGKRFPLGLVEQWKGGTKSARGGT